jgi:NAD(P)H dehydrogenase (quinone)
MKVLLVYAHPNPNSFNAALLQVALTTLQEAGRSVQVSDLYAMNFNPVLGWEELEATNHRRYAPEVRLELDKLHWADLVIFQFPDWWYGMPAIMKGWIDRVLAYGSTYDDQHTFETGLLKGKKAMIVMSVGSREEYFRQAPQRDLLRVLEPIHYGNFMYVGMEVLPPFLVYGPSEMSQAEREQVLQDYRKYLLSVQELKPLDFL